MNQFQSNDTDDSPGRLVGVEDADGQPWCFECADAEIRQAGPTAFDLDLYARDSARKRCHVCKRQVGTVTG